MEVVREITSISHDGFRNMWYPFHFEKDKRCNIINCEYIRESLDLIKLMQWMFATNNHNSNTEINYREASANLKLFNAMSHFQQTNTDINYPEYSQANFPLKQD